MIKICHVFFFKVSVLTVIITASALINHLHILKKTKQEKQNKTNNKQNTIIYCPIDINPSVAGSNTSDCWKWPLKPNIAIGSLDCNSLQKMIDCFYSLRVKPESLPPIYDNFAQ